MKYALLILAAVLAAAGIWYVMPSRDTVPAASASPTQTAGTFAAAQMAAHNSSRDIRMVRGRS